MQKIDIEKVKQMGPFEGLMFMVQKFNELVEALEGKQAVNNNGSLQLEGRAVVNILATIYKAYCMEKEGQVIDLGVSDFVMWATRNAERLTKIINE